MQELFQKTEDYVLDLVQRAPLSFAYGEGSYLFDSEGRRYLDFLCGIAVTSLGHAHPKILSALAEQSKRLIHVSNLFHIEEQSRLAELLVQKSFQQGKAFFFNSGTEANEAAFKLCRHYGQVTKNGAHRILSLKNSFHGRSTASICLSGQEKIHTGFGPLVPAHTYIERNDTSSLLKEFEKGEELCALFIELIQGEGGVHPLEKEYVKTIRSLCTERKVPLVIDEVQTGIGRTGKLFCYEHYGIVPDLMTLAKALGSGFPIGALLAAKEYESYLGRGQHGSTMGGNPLATRIAMETLHIIEEDKLLENVNHLSKYIFRHLKELQKKLPAIKTIRGMGFHIAMELSFSAKKFVDLCREKALILNATGENTIRIMPPLTVKQKEVDEGLGIIESALADLSS